MEEIEDIALWPRKRRCLGIPPTSLTRPHFLLFTKHSLSNQFITTKKFFTALVVIQSPSRV